MVNHHRGPVSAVLSARVAGMCIAGIVGVLAACGCSNTASKPAQSASSTPPAAAGGQAVATPSRAAASTSASGAGSRSVAQGAPGVDPRGPGSDAARSTGTDDGNDDDNAELVVSRDVVSRCPKLRLVRQHVAEFDPDMVWLAVLESLGECMGQGGPLADQNVGVSGDEEHRHVVREVLGTRGVAPTRVVATPTSVQGAAECQGGNDCSKRVEITIAPEP
jgi:hypothetical protein